MTSTMLNVRFRKFDCNNFVFNVTPDFTKG